MADNEKIGLDAYLGDDEFNHALDTVQKGMDKLVSKSESTAKKSGQAFTYWSGVVGGALSTAGGLFIDKMAGMITDGFKGMIDSAAEAQEIEAQLNAVLESTGHVSDGTKDAVLDLASSLSKVTKFEDDTIVATESVLLRFKDLGKDIIPDATMATLDLATALKMDASSAAKLLGKALEDPATGMGKLRAAGVDLTDEQEKLVKSMLDTGDKASAQKLILEELAKSIGGSAVAAGKTFSGQLQILQNDLGNVWEEIGTDLLPVLLELAKAGKDELVPMIKQDLLPAVKDFTSFLSGEGVPAIRKFFDELNELEAINKRWGVIWGEMRGTAKASEDGIVQDAGIRLPQLTDIIAFVMDSMQSKQVAGQKMLTAGWHAWESLTSGDLTQWSLDMSDLFDAAFSSFLSIVGLGGISLKDEFNKMFGGIVSNAVTWTNDFILAGEDMIGGIVTGLWNKAQDVVDALADIIMQAITNMKNILGIHSPSTVMAAIGEQMAAGLAIGFGEPLLDYALIGKSGFGGSSYSMPSTATSHTSNVTGPTYNQQFHLHVNSNMPSVRLTSDFGILQSLASAR